MGVFARFVGAYPIGDVGLAQFLIGVLGLLWSPFVAYRGWVSARSLLRKDGAAPPDQTWGDDTNHGLLLPCYIVWLMVACVIQMIQSIFNMLVNRLAIDGGGYTIEAVLNASVWGITRFSVEGLTFFLMHHSAGWHAVRNSLALAAAAVLITIGMFIPAFANYKALWGPLIIAGWNIVLGVFSLLLWLAPSSWIYRRPALLPLACFLTILRSVQTATYILQSFRADEAFLMQFVSRLLQHVFLLPMLYQAMILDTQFWQGRHPVKQQWYAQLIAPLDGIRFTLGSASGLVHRIDQLTSSTTIRQLNFGNLSLNMGQLLGAGGQARVYRGTYRGQQVAIKLLLCVELTQEVIEDFCTEARMLDELQHPNVVCTLGICIVPPTVAMVMELCGRGSLFDALRSPETAALSLRARLQMCRDCAAGVAFLHQHQFLHRDLKSHNFLLSNEWVVKLADLGVSQQADAPISSRRSLVRSSLGSSRGVSQSTLLQGSSSSTSQTHTTTSLLQLQHSAASIRGTPAWSAPEVLRGEPYTAAADVYSLALVCWEVMSSRVPFEHIVRQQQLLEAICGVGSWMESVPPSQRSRAVRLGGARPPVPADVAPPLEHLWESCWVQEAAKRPTSNSVVATIDDMLQHLSSTVAATPYRVTWPPDVAAFYAKLDGDGGSEIVQINPLAST